MKKLSTLKLRLMLSTLLVLIAMFGYSQSGTKNYRIVVQGKDTFALVPVKWIANSNAIHAFGDDCREIADSMLIQISTLQQIIENDKNISAEQDQITREILTEANNCILDNAKLKTDNGKLKRKVRILTGTSILLFIAVLL